MWIGKKKLAELERRVERLEGFVDEIVCADGNVMFSNSSRRYLVSEDSLRSYREMLIGEPSETKFP